MVGTSKHFSWKTILISEDSIVVKKFCTENVIDLQVKNALFCWQCLLFGRNTKSPRNSTDTNNMKNLYERIEKHHFSIKNIFATLKLKLIGRQIQNMLVIGII